MTTFLNTSYPFLVPWTALLASMVIVHIRRIRAESATVATTVIFILSDSFAEQTQDFSERLIEIAVGVGIGIVINLSTLPHSRKCHSKS